MNTSDSKPRFTDVIVQLINLDRRSDRIQYIDEVIPFAYDRFSAVDGNNLTQYYYESPACSELLEVARGQSVILGEIGCKLSHYLVWRQHYAYLQTCAPHADNKYLLVLEDDVRFTPDSLAKWNTVLCELRDCDTYNAAKWDVVYVGGQWTPNYGFDSPAHFDYQRLYVGQPTPYFEGVPGSGGLYARINTKHQAADISRPDNVWMTPLCRTAGAYVVSKRGVANLLSAVETDPATFMKTPLDMWIMEAEFRRQIACLDAFPHPFYQGGFNLMSDPRLIANDIHRGNYQTLTLC